MLPFLISHLLIQDEYYSLVHQYVCIIWYSWYFIATNTYHRMDIMVFVLITIKTWDNLESHVRSDVHFGLKGRSGAFFELLLDTIEQKVF
jgi:hypothetical protein